MTKKKNIRLIWLIREKMKHQYIFPSIEIVRLSSDTAILNSLGASGDIHPSVGTPNIGNQSGNRAPGRTEVF